MDSGAGTVEMMKLSPVYRKLLFLLKHVIFSFQRVIPPPPDCFITCSGKTDGIGAQTQAVFSTMLFAEDMGIQYVHTPFKEIAHNEKREPDWEANWERFFNLGKGEKHIDAVRKGDLKVVHLDDLVRLRKKKNTLYVVPHCHSYADVFSHNYINVTERFIEKYYSTPKDVYRSYYDPEKINVAVHVRRGDVSKNGVNSFRYTDGRYIASLLQKLLSLLSETERDVSVCLYSQGDAGDFPELHEYEVTFHLNECVFTTFHNLVLADVLVMSKSAFSYSAALLSRGVKLYEPFWHSPLKDWVVTNEHADFDPAAFKERIRGLLRRKAADSRCQVGMT